ncbi:unnamed protein product [Sphagnum tenellum]
MASLVATRPEPGLKPSDRQFNRRGFDERQPTRRPLPVVIPVRVSARVPRVFEPADLKPSTGPVVAAPGSNARSAFSARSSSTGPRTVVMQGTRLGHDVGPRKQARPVGGHAHQTRKIGRVHDPVDGHRSHRHRDCASGDPRPRT